MKIRKSPRYFLSADEKQRVIQAIQAAEQGTSGEIRLHVERHCRTEPLARAAEIFEKLGMAGTARRNAVLIYIALDDRKFAIYGDKGIDDTVERPFWNEIRDRMQDRFRAGEFCAGIVDAVERVGGVLHECFPGIAGDVNELPDEPSIDLE